MIPSSLFLSISMLIRKIRKTWNKAKELVEEVLNSIKEDSDDLEVPWWEYPSTDNKTKIPVSTKYSLRFELAHASGENHCERGVFIFEKIEYKISDIKLNQISLTKSEAKEGEMNKVHFVVSRTIKKMKDVKDRLQAE